VTRTALACYACSTTVLVVPVGYDSSSSCCFGVLVLVVRGTTGQLALQRSEVGLMRAVLELLATFVCFALARPRPWLDPSHRGGAAGGNRGPASLDNLFPADTVPCRGVGCDVARVPDATVLRNLPQSPVVADRRRSACTI